jgi:heptosyltransferase-2
MNIDRTYSNLLLIKPGAIGDLLQLTPVIRALAIRYPGARISILVGTQATATLFLYNPHVSEVIVFDRRGEHRTLLSLVGLWRRLYRANYDLVIHFQRSNLKAWFLATAALPCRVLVYHKSKDEKVHAVDNYLQTVSPLGAATQDRRLELYTGKDDERYADDLFADRGFGKKPVIALNPGASHSVNRWSADRFSALADVIVDRISANVIIIGGKEDEELARSVSASAVSKPIVLAGKTTLLQLGAILKKCDLLVSGDTGPLHLATAAGTRVVALFGAADPARTGPVGTGHRVIRAATVSCVPCRSRICTRSVYLDCMNTISVEDVVNTVLEMLKEAPARRI